MNYPDLSSFGLDPWWLVLAKALGIFVFLVLTVLVAILLETLNKVLAEAGASHWVAGYSVVRKRLDLVTKAPFFRGSTVRFEINNIFNSRPEVSGGSAGIPFAYQPDRLEPIGRTVGITFRKLFIPTRFIRRVIQEGQQGRRSN